MPEETLIKDLEVLNKYGIHARPASLLVKAAAKYESEISIGKDGDTVSCKSIMGVMTIEGYPGSMMRITIIGSDAKEAMLEIEELFLSKFYED